MLRQVFESLAEIVRGFAFVNRVDEKIDEPVESILIHGVNISQVRNGEKQHAAVLGNLQMRISKVSMAYIPMCNIYTDNCVAS